MRTIRLTINSLLYLLILLAVSSRPSPAYDYQPLVLGSQWTYDNPDGGFHFMTITGDRVVIGSPTRIRHQQDDSQTYENYWTSDVNGNLFPHGAYNYDGFQVAYLPPIQMLAPPLFAGKVWTTSAIHLFDLDGSPWGGESFDYPLRVYSEGIVNVPAGQFYAYGVGYDIESPIIITRERNSYDLLGRSTVHTTSSSTDNTTDWYTDGIGEVTFGYIYGDQFLLRTFDSPVPLTRPTWGQIRILFDQER